MGRDSNRLQGPNQLKLLLHCTVPLHTSLLRSHRSCLSLLPCIRQHPPGPASESRGRRRAWSWPALPRDKGLLQEVLGRPHVLRSSRAAEGGKAGRHLRELAEINKRKPWPEEQEIPWQPNTGGQDVETPGLGATSAARSTGCAAALNTPSSAESATCSQASLLAKEARSQETLIRVPCQGCGAALSPSSCLQEPAKIGKQAMRSDINQAPFVHDQLQATNKIKSAFSGGSTSQSSSLTRSDSWLLQGNY